MSSRYRPTSSSPHPPSPPTLPQVAKVAYHFGEDLCDGASVLVSPQVKEALQRDPAFAAARMVDLKKLGETVFEITAEFDSIEPVHGGVRCIGVS